MPVSDTICPTARNSLLVGVARLDEFRDTDIGGEEEVEGARLATGEAL
jgi:hypothetical protein